MASRSIVKSTTLSYLQVSYCVIIMIGNDNLQETMIPDISRQD